MDRPSFNTASPFRLCLSSVTSGASLESMLCGGSDCRSPPADFESPFQPLIYILEVLQDPEFLLSLAKITLISPIKMQRAILNDLVVYFCVFL